MRVYFRHSIFSFVWKLERLRCQLSQIFTAVNIITRVEVLESIFRASSITQPLIYFVQGAVRQFRRSEYGLQKKFSIYDLRLLSGGLRITLRFFVKMLWRASNYVCFHSAMITQTSKPQIIQTSNTGSAGYGDVFRMTAVMRAPRSVLTISKLHFGATAANVIEHDRSSAWPVPIAQRTPTASTACTVTEARSSQCTVASQCVHCCKGDASSQWEIATFGHLGLRNP